MRDSRWLRACARSALVCFACCVGSGAIGCAGTFDVTPQSAADVRPPERVEAETPSGASGPSGSAAGLATLAMRGGLAFGAPATVGAGTLLLVVAIVATSHPKLVWK